jgi:DNA-binding MarR family transcriptional regulator
VPELTFDLHVLTARLDRSADHILQAEYGLSYRRFRTLLTVGRLGSATQRAVAAELGISEPSASRMTGVLVGTGLLEAVSDPMGGNRRRLTLTPRGEEVVEQCRTLLENRFADLVQRSGVSYSGYARDTRRLLAALSAPPERRSTGSPARDGRPPATPAQ